MYRIMQTPTGWDVRLAVDASLVASFSAETAGITDWRATYAAALARIADELTALRAAGGDDAGVLPDVWESPDGFGIVYAQATGDGRDFTGCKFSWRDPQVSVVPLMLQTETDMGHFGAELAGFIEKFGKSGDVVRAEGRFYDSETGIEFRDMLLGDRQFGVSVDGGAVDYEYVCLEEDDDGWCIEDKITFLAYEIIGLTGTPFPAFAEAKIGLRGAARAVAASILPMVSVNGGPMTSTTWAISAPMPITAAVLAVPDFAPREWFELVEPGDGDERYVEQPNGHIAIPLTITDDGQVYGHLAVQGSCHTGITDRCQDVPISPSNCAHFNLASTRCADGSRVATGVLTVGCDHAPLSYTAQQARDFYAHSGLGWADVHASNGYHGPWIAGAVRPGVDDVQLRMIMGSMPSGDWRAIAGALELVGAHQVNQPGFPVLRERALAAAAGRLIPVNASKTKARVCDGEVLAVVAAGVVRECPECVKRRTMETLAATNGSDVEVLDALRTLGLAVALIERRTRHLRTAERDATVERLEWLRARSPA